MTLLLVLVMCNVLPALMLVIVVTTSWMELVVINVLEGVTVSVSTVVLEGDEPEDSSAEEGEEEDVGVKVEVEVITSSEEELGGSVTTEEVTTGGGDVGEDEGEGEGEDEGEDEDEVSLSSSPVEVAVGVAVSDAEPPVDRLTFWRFKRAMASSRGSAATAEAATSIEKRRMAS